MNISAHDSIMDNQDKAQWFVLRAIFKKELTVRDALRKAGLQVYVPLCYRIEIVRGRKIPRLVPAITELVFVYGTEDAIAEAKSKIRCTCYWLTRPIRGQKRQEKVRVRDNDMDNFIRITQQAETNIQYLRPEEISLAKGDRIRIHGGALDGIEGTLLRVKGRRDKQLVVTIPDLAVVAVSVHPEVIEIISQRSMATPAILSDSKELIRLSTSMLSCPPDQEGSPHEWNLLHREIQRLYQSLLPHHGIIPSIEGQLSLALLLAERALNVVNKTTIERCQVATQHMRPSKLKNQILVELESSK